MAPWDRAARIGEARHNSLVMSMEPDKPVVIPSSLLAILVRTGHLLAALSKPLVERPMLAHCSLQTLSLGLAAVACLNPPVARIPQGQVFHPMAVLHTPAVPTTLRYLIHRPRARAIYLQPALQATIIAMASRHRRAISTTTTTVTAKTMP